MPVIVCGNCKAEIPDRSESCPECGSPAEQQLAVKCPECSNMVVFSSDSCPECGFPRDLLEAEVETPRQQSDSSAGPPGTEANDVAPPTPARDESNHPADREAIALDSMVTTITTMMKSSDKAHEDLINKIKEQNLMAVSGIQEILASFNNELKAESEKIKATHASATADITAMSNQAKEQIQKFAAKISIKSGNTLDYTLYICAAALVFSLINLFVTAYIVRLIK